MLNVPDLIHHQIYPIVQEEYGLQINKVDFLPIGADINTAVYRLSAVNGATYFLKLRRENFSEIAATIPAYLCHVKGIHSVLAPIPTKQNSLWFKALSLNWTLYPFVEGMNSFEYPMSDREWIILGSTLKAVHETVLPPALFKSLSRETFSSCSRNVLRAMKLEEDRFIAFDDDVTRELLAFLQAKWVEVILIVDRTEQLSKVLIARSHATFVLCHADIHAGNVLIDTNKTLFVVDWDTLILAPKERDLMFIGGGVGGAWNDPKEKELFFEGYGETHVDPFLLTYYRYERIIEDIVAYYREIITNERKKADRALALQQLVAQFLPNNVVDIAHRTWLKI